MSELLGNGKIAPCSTACAKTSPSFSTATRPPAAVGSAHLLSGAARAGLAPLAGAPALAPGLALAGALAVALEPLADRHRDPSRAPPSAGGCSSTTAWASSSARRRKSATIARFITALRWAGRRGTRASAIRRWAARWWSAPGAKILGPDPGRRRGQGRLQRGRGARRARRRDGGRHPGAHRHRRGRACAARRQAAKIGFSAYAIRADMNDPMVQAIHRLLDHAAATEERFEALIAAAAARRLRLRRRQGDGRRCSTRSRSTKCLSELIGLLVD